MRDYTWTEIHDRVQELETENSRLREAFTAFIHAHCPNDPCMECGGGLDPQSAIVCNKEALENAINAVVLKEGNNA